jgi:hypothetical protein
MSDLLIDFEWHRDVTGYRVVDFNSLNLPWRFPDDDPWRCVVPLGRKSDLNKYRPFRYQGDLCFVFSRVRNTDELLRFINNHGPLTDYYSRLGEGPDWKYGNTGRELKEPNPEAYMSSTGVVAFWRCKDGSLVPADFIPGDEVPVSLQAAEMFRQFLNLKQRNKRRELASFLTSYDAKLFQQLNQSNLDFASDAKGKVRLRLKPSSLLSALWYQLGLKLSGDTNVRTCRHCNSIFEAGVGTGRRLDAQFCSNEHKVEFFNRNRHRRIDGSR